MDRARLITIPFSHYCEKARWVLDAVGVDYREEPHAPVLHLWPMRAAGGKTVPVLVHGGEVFGDSTAIAAHADALAAPERKLLPIEADTRSRVLALEDELDETLGVDARLLVYWLQLREAKQAREFVERLMGLGSPLARVVAPMFRALIFRSYRVDERRARRAEARVRDLFARLGGAIERHGYLASDRFTLADLTFASLAAPLLAPPEHPVTGRLNVKPPPELGALRDELSAMPAGRHALRMYTEHRRADATRG